MKYFRSEEYRKKMSETQKKRGVGKWMKGRKWSKESLAKRSLSQSGEKHFAWKGDNVSYAGLHLWVYRKLGRPFKCEHCGTNDLTKKYEWANKSHQYKRDINDWLRLCRSCHEIYDKELIKQYV